MVNMQKQTGFTLVELMVSVTIMGIAASIALPSYRSYSQSSIRVDECIKPLAQLAFQAEKLKGLNNTYPSTIAAMNMSATSEQGNYTYTIKAGTTGSLKTSFKASCIPVDSAADPSCGTLSIDSFGARTATGSKGVDCWR